MNYADWIYELNTPFYCAMFDHAYDGKFMDTDGIPVIFGFGYI
jgi:hypothetical protein